VLLQKKAPETTESSWLVLRGSLQTEFGKLLPDCGAVERFLPDSQVHYPIGTGH
jgi:hypothetical protein